MDFEKRDVIAVQRSGLITQQRMSRQLIYSADFDAMHGLTGYLPENCCGQRGSECATKYTSILEVLKRSRVDIRLGAYRAQ